MSSINDRSDGGLRTQNKGVFSQAGEVPKFSNQTTGYVYADRERGLKESRLDQESRSPTRRL